MPPIELTAGQWAGLRLFLVPAGTTSLVDPEREVRGSRTTADKFLRVESLGDRDEAADCVGKLRWWECWVLPEVLYGVQLVTVQCA